MIQNRSICLMSRKLDSRKMMLPPVVPSIARFYVTFFMRVFGITKFTYKVFPT